MTNDQDIIRASVPERGINRLPEHACSQTGSLSQAACINKIFGLDDQLILSCDLVPSKFWKRESINKTITW